MGPTFYALFTILLAKPPVGFASSAVARQPGRSDMLLTEIITTALSPHVTEFTLGSDAASAGLHLGRARRRGERAAGERKITQGRSSVTEEGLRKREAFGNRKGVM